MKALSRRLLLQKGAAGLGGIALASLLEPPAAAADYLTGKAKAKRVISLFQSGGPSQLDLFDHKPGLMALDGTSLPASVRGTQRLTTMTNASSRLPVVAPRFSFAQYGASGAWFSELLPHTASIADHLCVVRSLYTEAINHDPAITFLQTGSTFPGHPSVGAWVSYGLGSLSDNLPTYVVLTARNNAPDAQPLYARLWGSGFLPSNHQGVPLRPSGAPVLYLSDGTTLPETSRRGLFDSVKALNELHRAETLDPEVDARIASYELAFRMQSSAPEATDLSDEPESTFALYGPDARIPGTHARNCLLARRLIERGVRFVQLFHRDWDQHTALPERIRRVCLEDDQGSAALVKDLAQRGLLEDTLVIWGGEFGRTVYSQSGNAGDTSYGRDHHPRCFTIWMAGGGVKPGLTYGTTDDFGYNVAENGVHVHDLHATMLALLGIDHARLSYRFQGRNFRLTDTAGKVVTALMA